MCIAMIDGLQNGFNTTDINIDTLSSKTGCGCVGGSDPNTNTNTNTNSNSNGTNTSPSPRNVQYDEDGQVICDVTDIFNFYDVNWYHRHRTPIEDISIYPGRMPTPQEHDAKAMHHRNTSEFFGNVTTTTSTSTDCTEENKEEGEGDGDGFFGGMFA